MRSLHRIAIAALVAAGSALAPQAGRAQPVITGTSRAADAPPSGDPPFDPDAVHEGCPAGSQRSVTAERRVWSVWCKGIAGKSHGPKVMVHSNGVVAVRGEMRDGDRVGWWRTWSEQGELLTELEYQGDKAISRHRVGAEAREPRRSTPADPVHPCPDGAIVGGESPPRGSRQWCERDRGDGAYVLYGPLLTWRSKTAAAPSSREEYRNGVKEGTWIKWRDGRKKEESHYVAGKRQGTQTTWHKNGQKACEVEHKNGIARHVVCWNEAGQPRSDIRYDEKRNLLARTLHHPNGQKLAEETWKDGERSNVAREWWPNGQLKRASEAKGAGTVISSYTPEGRLAEVKRIDADHDTERETFAVYDYDDPDWAPAPIPRGDERAPTGRLECPAGAQRLKRSLSIGLGTTLARMGDGGGGAAEARC